MSTHCMKRVWDHSSQKGSALLLLLAIAHYADESGFACARVEALAAWTRMSRRQTLRLIAHLEDAAELLVLRRAGRSNLYLVCTGADWKDLAAVLVRAAGLGAILPDNPLERVLTLLEDRSFLEDGPPATGHPPPVR